MSDPLSNFTVHVDGNTIHIVRDGAGDKPVLENEKMDPQIEKQMGVNAMNFHRQMDDVAARFQTSTAFTEARANQHYESSSLTFLSEMQNALESDGLARLALHKKVAENANPSTQGA